MKSVHVVAGTCEIQNAEEISEIKRVVFHTADQLMPYFHDGDTKLLQSSASYIFQSKTYC